jgi:hypothetical protein
VIEEPGTTYVLLDESGNFHATKALIVGALVLNDYAQIESAAREMFDEMRASPELEDHKSFEKFLTEGFHYSSNPFEIQIDFMNRISRLHGYRMFFAFSQRERLPDLDDNDRSLVLYATMLVDVISYIRTPKIVFLFEHNAELNPRFAGLVANARERAVARNRRREMPVVESRIAHKQDPLALGIVDYAMAVISNWIDADFTVDPDNKAFRMYRRFERNTAVIHNFDDQLRSNRSDRRFH